MLRLYKDVYKTTISDVLNLHDNFIAKIIGREIFPSYNQSYCELFLLSTECFKAILVVLFRCIFYYFLCFSFICAYKTVLGL